MELGIDFERAGVPRNISVLSFKTQIINYIRNTNCSICFTDKVLSCQEAITAIENGKPEGIAILERVISDALGLINSRV